MPITIKNNPEDAGGVNNCIVITIPARGETGWADLVRAAFKKISQHDHTGNENGAQLGVASLEDGAVTKAKINANVAGEGLTKDATSGALNVKIDDVTIERDAPTNTLRLKDDGVSAAKLNADVAGLGLIQNGVDESLEVNVDDSTIEIDTDIVRVKDLGIVTAKLADAAITTAKLFNGSVTTDKIADDAVTAAKISFISDTVETDAVQNDTLVWNANAGAFLPGPGGGGSGSSGINHIPVASSDAEAFNFLSNDWVISDPTDYGIGAAFFGLDPNIYPLRGDKSFTFRAYTGAQVGQTIDIPFSVDVADKAKKHLISFDYKPYAPLGVNNFVDDAVRISIIKTVGGVDQEIRVNGEDIKAVTQASTHYAQFQTDPSASATYKLRFTLKDVSATNAGSLILDNIKVSPVGVNDSVSSQDIVCNLQGLSSSKQLADGQDTVIDTWSTPSIDTVGGWDAVNQYYVVPETGYYDIDVTAQVFDDSGSDVNRVILQIKQGSNIIKLGGILTSTVQYNYVHLSKTAAYLEKGQSIYFVARQDQAGTGTASVLSSSVYTNASIAKRPSLSLPESVGSGRDIYVVGSGSGGNYTISAETERIPFVILQDSTNSMSTTDNGPDTFTVPETGSYTIEGNVACAITTVTNQTINAFVNGSISRSLQTSDSSTDRYKHFSGILRLNKGDVLDFRFSGGADVIVENAGTHHWIHIEKLSSAQTVLETETVVFKANLLNDTSSETDATMDQVAFDNIPFDSHGGWDSSTYKYTISVSGYYQCNLNLRFADISTGANIQAYIKSDQTNTENIATIDFVSTSSTNNSGASNLIYLNKGSKVWVQATSTDSPSSWKLIGASGAGWSYFSLARIK